MRQSVVLTISGSVAAVAMLTLLISTGRPADAATSLQCIKAGTTCATKCGLGTVPSDWIAGCLDACGAVETKCVLNSSDAGDKATKAREKRNRDRGSGGGKKPPKGGKKGHVIITDPVRPKAPQSTGTPATAPAGNTGPAISTAPSVSTVPPKPPFPTAGSGSKDWSIGGVKGYRP